MTLLRALKKKQLHINKDSFEFSKFGHAVDFGTFTCDHHGYMDWITKLNKHKGKKGEEASIFEAVFSEIALLFIKPGLTSAVRIVANENGEISGIASEHFNMQIKKEMDKDILCYSMNPNNWSFDKIPHVTHTKKKILQLQRSKLKKRTNKELSDQILTQSAQLEANKKAIHFLDKMPKNFFALLMKKHTSGEVVVNMESLASILSISYVLEEDDLHKGNIGFYVTDTRNNQGNIVYNAYGQPQKQFIFFKIDHDLMFIDSIMSQKDMRTANIFYNKNSFKISIRDLENFPDLKDSGNHYWPTQERFLVKGNKAYTSKKERKSFANLKNNEQFCNAKWSYFLKSAIIPRGLIKKLLTDQLDITQEMDKINRVNNAIFIRVAKLKNQLIASEQFRNYMKQHRKEAFEAIKKEFLDYVENTGLKKDVQNALMVQLHDNFKSIVACCANHKILSPGSKSILLHSYDFSINNPTEKDIIIALNQFKKKNENSLVDTNTFTAASIAIDVINKSQYKKKYADQVTQLQKEKYHYLKPHDVKSLKDFEAMTDKIRASNLPLKQQKIETLLAFKKVQLPPIELQKLKKELQKKEPDSPSLKYIKQLRSNLWIIRKLFGTYGRTSTSSMMLNEINSQIAKSRIFTPHPLKKTSSLFKNQEKISHEYLSTPIKPK